MARQWLFAAVLVLTVVASAHAQVAEGHAFEEDLPGPINRATILIITSRTSDGVQVGGIGLLPSDILPRVLGRRFGPFAGPSDDLGHPPFDGLRSFMEQRLGAVDERLAMAMRCSVMRQRILGAMLEQAALPLPQPQDGPVWADDMVEQGWDGEEDLDSYDDAPRSRPRFLDEADGPFTNAYDRWAAAGGSSFGSNDVEARAMIGSDDDQATYARDSGYSWGESAPSEDYIYSQDYVVEEDTQDGAMPLLGRPEPFMLGQDEATWGPHDEGEEEFEVADGVYITASDLKSRGYAPLSLLSRPEPFMQDRHHHDHHDRHHHDKSFHHHRHHADEEDGVVRNDPSVLWVPLNVPSGAEGPAIRWSLWDQDGRVNTGVVIFITLSAACAGVWAALLMQCCAMSWSGRDEGEYVYFSDEDDLSRPMVGGGKVAGAKGQKVVMAAEHAVQGQFVTLQYAPMPSEGKH